MTLIVLCISLLFLFLVNIILDLKQIEKNSFDMGSGGTYNPKKSKLSTQLGEDAMYEEEVTEEQPGSLDHLLGLEDLLERYHISQDDLLQELTQLSQALQPPEPPEPNTPVGMVQCTRIFSSVDITLDSLGNLCDVKGVNAQSNCCQEPLQESALECDATLKCCSNLPYCVHQCMEFSGESFEECTGKCRISSAQINHNRYYNDIIYKYCYYQGSIDDVTIQIAKPKQNCNEVCLEQDSKCNAYYFRFLNNCEALNQFFPCGECNNDFNSFAPAMKLSSNQLNSLTNLDDMLKVEKGDLMSIYGVKGLCLTSSYEMLFNCDNSDSRHLRICPCIKNQNEDFPPQD